MAFAPTLRRSIGLVRLAGDDHNDRDLRLVQGSSLDRLVSDKALRGRLSVVFSDSEEGVRKALLDEGSDALDELDRSFRSQKLPHQLDLGMNVGRGQSVSALIGLTAKPGLVRLPLSSWGAGTRRLASLAVARACRTGCPVMLIDEAERGLEPYRQRALAVELAKGLSQVFMTTHSAAILSASSAATIWHLSAQQEIGCLDPTKTAIHLTRDPETFLSRLPIVAEGPTEVGFVSELLEQRLSSNLLDLGVHIANATGNSFALALMVEMARARFLFAGFVDNEGTKPEGWRRLKQQLGGLLMQWDTGCTESNVIAHLQTEQLEEFVTAQDEEVTQRRINTIIERLRWGREEELRFAKYSFSAVREVAGESLKALIEAAACGNTPEGMPERDAKIWKKHSRAWFKNELGGRELARKMFDLQVWPKIEPQLEHFVQAVFDAVMPSQPDPSDA